MLRAPTNLLYDLFILTMPHWYQRTPHWLLVMHTLTTIACNTPTFCLMSTDRPF